MAENSLPRIADNTELSAEFALDSKNILNNIQFSMDELAITMMEFVEFQRLEAIRAKLASENIADAIKQSSPSDAGDGDKNVEGDSTFILAELGLIGTLAAALIGTTIGVITGQIELIKTFAKAAKAFVPQSLVDLVTDMKGRMLASVDNFRDGVNASIDFVKVGVQNGLARIKTLLSFGDDSTFITGFREAVTNGVARIKTLFSFADDAPLGRIATSFKTALDTLSKPFNTALDMIRSAVGTVRSVSSGATSMFNVFDEMGGLVRGISSVVRTIFVPLGIVMTAIDTIKGAIAGFEEEGVLGGIEGAITGLFNSIVGAPLDLVKSAVAWVLGIFGFENAQAALDSFSFSDLISDSIGAIFDMLKSAVDWIGQLFTDPVGALTSLWSGIVGDGGLVDLLFKPIDSAIAWVKGLFGFETTEESWTLSGAVKGAFENAKAWLIDLFTFDTSEGLLAGIATKFMDIVFAPVNLAIAWVQGIFGWGEPEDPIKVSDIIMDAYNAIKDWFIEKFANIADFLPSIDDIKTSLMSRLPSWLIPDSAKTPEMRAQEMQDEIDELQGKIAEDSWRSVGYSAEDEKRQLAELQAAQRALLEEMSAGSTNQAVVVNNNINQGDNVNASTNTSAPVVVNGAGDGRGMRPDRS